MYNYLLFAVEKNALDITGPAVRDLVGRSKGISDVVALINSPDLSNKTLVLLRFNDLEIGAISLGFNGWEIYDLPEFGKTSSNVLLEDLSDQLVAQEIIVSSLNMHNSIKLKDKTAFKYSYGVLTKDKKQTIRIIRNQLEMLYAVSTDPEVGLIKLLKLWWETIRNDEKNNT